MSKVFVLLMLCPLFGQMWTCNISDNVTDVHKYILNGYNRNARPVKNPKDQVLIKVNLYLISLDDFDIKSQTVGSRLFLEMVWRDEFLTWDPCNFDNKTRISMDSSNLWIPDLLIGNDEGPFTFIDYPMIGRATVHSDGTIVIWPYFSIKIGCDVKIVYYPFDEQSFYFRIGSWSFTTKDILLEFLSDDLKLNKYTKNGEWDIAHYYLKAYNASFDTEYYGRLEYHMTIQRKPLYYILNMIAPVVVTSLLNIMCFILPVESAERVTFSTSIFLTMAVFLTIVSQSLPKTSDGVSITFVYICLQLFGSFFTIVLNVIVLDLYHRKNAAEKSVIAKFLRATCRYRKYRKERNAEKEAETLNQPKHDANTNDPFEDKLETVDFQTPTEDSTDQTKLRIQETLKMIHEQAHGTTTDDRSEIALTLNSMCLTLALFWNIFLIFFLIIYVSVQ